MFTQYILLGSTASASHGHRVTHWSAIRDDSGIKCHIVVHNSGQVRWVLKVCSAGEDGDI